MISQNEKKDLLKFIKDNDLKFDGTGSELNSNVVNICGFCWFLNDYVENFSKIELDDLIDIIGVKEKYISKTWEYCNLSNYGLWWLVKANSSQFKIDKKFLQ